MASLCTSAKTLDADCGELYHVVAETLASLNISRHSDRFMNLLKQAGITSIEGFKMLSQQECERLRLPIELINPVMQRIQLQDGDEAKAAPMHTESENRYSHGDAGSGNDSTKPDMQVRLKHDGSVSLLSVQDTSQAPSPVPRFNCRLMELEPEPSRVGRMESARGFVNCGGSSTQFATTGVTSEVSECRSRLQSLEDLLHKTVEKVEDVSRLGGLLTTTIEKFEARQNVEAFVLNERTEDPQREAKHRDTQLVEFMKSQQQQLQRLQEIVQSQSNHLLEQQESQKQVQQQQQQVQQQQHQQMVEQLHQQMRGFAEHCVTLPKDIVSAVQQQCSLGAGAAASIRMEEQLQKAMGTMGARSAAAASQRMEEKLEEAMGKMDLQLQQFKQTEAVILDRWNRCAEPKLIPYTPSGHGSPLFHDALTPMAMGSDDLGGHHFCRGESFGDSVGMETDSGDSTHGVPCMPASFSSGEGSSPGINSINSRPDGFCMNPGKAKLLKGFEMERPTSLGGRSAIDGSDSDSRPGSQFESHTPFHTQPFLDVQPPRSPSKRPSQHGPRSNYLHQQGSAPSEGPSMFAVKAIGTTPRLSSVFGM